MLTFDDNSPLPTAEAYIEVSYYDPMSTITSTLILTLYHDQMVKAVKMFDKAKRKVFLKKTRIPDQSLASFKEGSQVKLFGRSYLVQRYLNLESKLLIAKLFKTSILLPLEQLDQYGSIEAAHDILRLQIGRVRQDTIGIDQDTPVIWVQALSKEMSQNFDLELLALSCPYPEIVVIPHAWQEAKQTHRIFKALQGFSITNIKQLTMSDLQVKSYLELFFGFPQYAVLTKALKGSVTIMLSNLI